MGDWADRGWVDGRIDACVGGWVGCVNGRVDGRTDECLGRWRWTNGGKGGWAERQTWDTDLCFSHGVRLRVRFMVMVKVRVSVRVKVYRLGLGLHHHSLTLLSRTP